MPNPESRYPRRCTGAGKRSNVLSHCYLVDFPTFRAVASGAFIPPVPQVASPPRTESTPLYAGFSDQPIDPCKCSTRRTWC